MRKNKKFTRALSLLLIAFMLLSSAVIKKQTMAAKAVPEDEWNNYTSTRTTKTNSTITSYNVGNTLEFGWYPQSKVTDSSIISQLNAKAGNNQNWTSYNYYSGSGVGADGNKMPGTMKSGNWMRYTDIVLNSNKYRGVVFDEYRPNFTGDTNSSDNSSQDENGYNINTVYWFKYEPIKWRVLNPATGLVMSETILDSQAFNNYMIATADSDEYNDETCWGDPQKTYYANNYEKSSIRKWLDEDFKNIAFSSSQLKNCIATTRLDNSAYDNSRSAYNSNPTNDKIFLLSWNDALNESYGFNSSSDEFNTSRQAYGSDYAKSQGLTLYTDSSSSWYLKASWHLRSAGYYSFYECAVYFPGNIQVRGIMGQEPSLNASSFGIRPAFNFNTSAEITQCKVTDIDNSPSTPTENIYNLGEETYSFENFSDYHARGHCFGMSATSAGYYTNNLDVTKTGIDSVKKINQLNKNSLSVKQPICYYQARQGSFVNDAYVAGDNWVSAVDYIKDHSFDNSGSLLVIVWRWNYIKDDWDGHAVNLLYYKNVGGQDRIYVYDNNFPNDEVYFYQNSDGDIFEAPYNSFGRNSIDYIYLMDIDAYFENIKNYKAENTLYSTDSNIMIENALCTPMAETDESKTTYMYELPKEASQVIITPLVDNATFTYLGQEYNFGEVDADTVGVLKIATESMVDGEAHYSGAELRIVDKSEITSVTIGSPSTTTISYGDSIVLHANIENLPTGARVVWEASNGNFSYSVSPDGSTCTISPKSSGDTEFTAKIVDSNGKVLSSDTQKMTSKAGFWQKLVAFFKSLFGSNQVIPYTVKNLFR